MARSVCPFSLLVAMGVVFLAHGNHVMAGAWDMDTTFGEGGLVAYDPGWPIQMEVLPDGTPLEVASSNTGFVLRHRDLNGRPDSTFGVGGKVEITFPMGFATYDRLPLVDSNGRLLWCGAMDTNNDNVQDRAILRFTPAGGLDPAFGVGGIVSQVSAPFPVTNSGTYGDRCDSLAIQPDGRILATVARYEQFYGDAISLTLLRFNQDGSTDSTLGAGTGAVPIATRYYEGGSNVRVLSNGSITVFNGDLDVTFNASGTITSGPKDSPFLPRPSYVYDDPVEWQVLGIPGSGDMLLVGNDNGKRLLVVREHSDGTLDPGFGASGTGVALVERSPSAVILYSFATASLSQDGMRLYIVRYDSSLLGEPGGGEIIRLIASGARAGQVDPDFGVGGRVNWPFPGFALTEQSRAAAVLIGSGHVLRLSQASGPSPGILGFTNGSYATGPENTSYNLRVVRAAGHDGVASVAYQTADTSDSGKAGVNYESAAGMLRWADGDAVDQQITLKLLKGASNVLPVFFLRLDHPQGAMLVADAVNIGVKASSPAPVSVPPPVVPASTSGAPGVAAGGGAMDALTLLLFLLGGSAALRARARSRLS